MSNIGFIKSFSKGQITIPKEVRNALGIGDEFWLRLSIENGKIIAEPIEQKRSSSRYAKSLLSIKGDWFNSDEIEQNRKQIDQQLQKRSL